MPLRTPELAEHSRISKQSYDVEKVEQVLQQLKGEAAEIMLFLKTIECIEVRERALSMNVDARMGVKGRHTGSSSVPTLSVVPLCF